MNLNPINLNYQDGLNTYPIVDYIDDKIDGIISGTALPISSNIYSISSNLFINNSNIDGEIRFQTLYEYPNNNNVGVKIDSLGKLQVYHNYNINYPLITQGYFNVEDDLAGLKQSSLVSSAEMLLVQGQISGIDSTLAIHTAQIAELETIERIHTAILQEDIDNYTFFEDLLSFGNDLDINIARQTAQFRLERNKEILNNLMVGVGLAAVGGVVAGIYNSIEMNSQSNLYLNVSNGNISQTARDETTSNFSYYNRRSIIDLNTNLSNAELINGFINSNIITTQFIPSLNTNEIKISNTNISNIFVASNVLSNININQGFINSNITNQQFIPELKSNKLILGNITTPNVAYQAEMTGDLNLNMLYLNSTSLSSLLNQKQDNMTATQPIYITTANIGLNYDSSLTKIGNSLSVVRTATTPIIITGNDFSLSYDSSLTKIGNSLSVVKTASVPLVISGNNWTLNYDSTLTLSGNNLKVSDATASKWITSGTNIYNNNTGNVGINTTNPSYKLHIEDGSLFIGDTAIGNGSQTDNGYRLVFDSSYTATGANKCNKILLHKNDNAPTYVAGFGVEAQGLTYSTWTGGYHNFYTSTTSTSGGFLSCSIYRDNFRFYGSTNAGAGGVISNGNNGASAYSYVSLANDTGNGILFLNSSTKTTDGGANCLTLRNDVSGGDLRLSANLDTPYIDLKKSSGNVGIDTTAPAYKLTINGSLGCGAINSTSITTNNNAINAGTGGLTCGAISSGTITTNNNSITAGTATITATNFSGKITPTVNVWNTSSDGYNRFYFANTSRTYFSSGSGFEFRHSTDAGIAVMSVTGQLGLQNLSPIGTLSLGDSSVTNSDGSLVIHKKNSTGGTRQFKIGYDSMFWETYGDFGSGNVPGTWLSQFSVYYSAPNNACYIASSGSMYLAGTLTQNSDQRIKSNIRTIENSLWKLLQLRGVYYTHIIEGTRNIGLIAQEVEGIIPEVVFEGQKNDIKGVSYGNLVALLIEAIKEQQEIINNQEKKINDIYEILSRNGLS